MRQQESMTYAKAGVKISDGNRFAAMVKELVRAAWPDFVQEIGGFAGGGPIPRGCKIVKGCCDGAGTKAILSALVEDFQVGQCALAMSAVDAFAAGARPVYALDTFKTGALNPEKHIEVIKSVIRGCQQAGCVLIGGETAEMPGLYRHPWMIDVDTSVIAFPDPKLATVPIKAGHQVFGWASKGPAANGLSLIRPVFGLTERPSLARRRLEKYWPELGCTLAKAILRPTPIHISNIDYQRQKGVIFSGHAHITGGGLVENIPRILPPDLKVRIRCHAWNRPSLFRLVQKLGNVPFEDMDRTFNQGIMMVSIVDNSGPCLEVIDHPAGTVEHIGEVLKRKGNEPQVELVGEYIDEPVED
ncbi:MAG: AIR synthase related protein [Candidatus Buchananbacteria bacterium]